MLKPLLLPQLVEERRKREETFLDAEMNSSQPSDTQEPLTSDVSSPVTPTLSPRGHGHIRYSSSVFSIDPSVQSTLVESPSSPTFVSMKTNKRPLLPDVQEEPLERLGQFDMLEDLHDVYDWSCDDKTCNHHEKPIVQSAVQLSTNSDFEYLTDGFLSDTELGLSVSKKRRSGDSPFTVIANRFGTRFPVFSRKWRTRKGSNPLSPLSDANDASRLSHGASSRSSSVSNSVHQGLPISYGGVQMPPTPARSEFAGHEAPYRNSGEIGREEREEDDRQQGFASTPLLPPLMMGDSSANSDVPVQSPLQSPSVAEPSESNTGICTPIAGVTAPSLRGMPSPLLSTKPNTGACTPIASITTPSLRGMPSPPLSTKPSVSSIRRTHSTVPAHLLPSSEIPPIVIADIGDKWSNTLGHANFTIQPVPYMPSIFDISACRQLRADWDLARCNYTKHLVRTGEHYGVTSKTYHLTEEKWRETDEIWRRNNEITVANTAASGKDVFQSLKQKRLDDGESNVMTKIPSLNDPRSEGKFPQLGDEDIVGPMVRGAAQLQRSPSKKAKLMRFFTEKFPAGFGRLNA